ncbi:outer membrane protein assembly factor BamB family protein [Streptomyces beihaiensis]|uniref:PQQ-like beta-propeller repeat protein n=1 Tax=Streptomyces beihaiensis TaxID=2984495 RepID=A0ABT3TVW4_9ACTN|nr:PQQ-binding-like beta-propeller repeat protein [Streptomyces beihaiensis]MCX3060631.1 PQQ-like beta-propeller repeat protein [Streptomyces beihaiensis]
MTQPPSQPPSGGFGPPPQDPRDPQGQGPQTPPPPPPPGVPPAPGYGYPQQPPQPGGPYGYPQPGPYGEPPRPGYGYPGPQQPPYPGPPAPGGPGGGPGGVKGKTWAIAAGALALLLVAGGVVYAVVGGGDKKDTAHDGKNGKSPEPSTSASVPVNPGDGQGDGRAGTDDLNAGRRSGEAKVLWYKMAPKVPGDGAQAPGMWITGEVAVKAAYKELLAYDVADGKVAWPAIKFPQKICAVTRTPSADGKIAVAYMSGTSERANCNQLQEVDLATGKKGWFEKIPERESPDDYFDGTGTSVGLTYVGGDTLVVGREQSGLGLDARTGKKKFVVQQYGNDCFPKAYTGDAHKLISVASCGAGGDNTHEELRRLNPETGKAMWTRKYPKGWSVSNVYSSTPLVVYATNEDKKTFNIASYKEGSSAVMSEVSSSVKNLDTSCGGSDFDFMDTDLNGCQGVVVDSGTLYMPTKGKTDGANDVVAISLASGKERWRAKSPADQPLRPLTTRGGAVIAYMEASFGGDPGRVVSIPVSGSHTPKTLLQNPRGAAQVESGFYSKDIQYVGGRFYLSALTLNGDTKGPQKLMLAYGN